MKIEVNLRKKHFFIALIAFSIFSSIFVVNAYNSNPGNPSLFGHSTNEVDWSSPLNNSFVRFGSNSGLFYNGVYNAWDVSIYNKASACSGGGLLGAGCGASSLLRFMPYYMAGPVTQNGVGYWAADVANSIAFTSGGTVLANDFCTTGAGGKCLDNLTVQSSIPTPPNCAAGQVLTYHNGAWSCINLPASTSPSITVSSRYSFGQDSGKNHGDYELGQHDFCSLSAFNYYTNDWEMRASCYVYTWDSVNWRIAVEIAYTGSSCEATCFDFN